MKVGSFLHRRNNNSRPRRAPKSSMKNWLFYNVIILLAFCSFVHFTACISFYFTHYKNRIAVNLPMKATLGRHTFCRLTTNNTKSEQKNLRSAIDRFESFEEYQIVFEQAPGQCRECLDRKLTNACPPSNLATFHFMAAAILTKKR